MNETKAIQVWLDNLSGQGTGWIVSEDMVENRSGGALSTHTLEVFEEDQKEEAIKRGREIAAKRELRFIPPEDAGRPIVEEN